MSEEDKKNDNNNNTTLLKNIKINEEVKEDQYSIDIEDIKDIDKESLYELVTDLSMPLQQRLTYINIFYDKFGLNDSLEIINRIGMMYQFSGTKILQKYLFQICISSTIHNLLKITASKSLCIFEKYKDLGFKALNVVCQDFKDVPTPCQIECVCLLMEDKKYKKQAKQYFCKIINNLKLDCDYRYKTILCLETLKITNSKYFITQACLDFINNSKNMTMYRILAGQYIIQKCKIKNTDQIELILMLFAQDPDLDYNLRADSADVILRLGSEENKITAREIIMMLGRVDGTGSTIFDNAQNVHIDEIEDSVVKILEFLSNCPTMTVGNGPITYDFVKKQIEDLLKLEKPEEEKKEDEEKSHFEQKEDKIQISLNRIFMDRALYSKYNCKLLLILLKIWSYMETHKYKDEMRKRLLEELVDMSGTCSTGFASRLANTISGFGEFNIKISWRDQIVANFNGRLNAKITKIENEEIKGKILEEMTINSDNYSERPTFLRFFRKNMLGIREEMYEEFKEHIDDPSFDLYFRAAISIYETGGYI